VKPYKIILPACTALILLLSSSQISFLYQLVKYALIPRFDVKSRSTYLLDHMGINPRTQTFIDEYRKNSIFLSVAGKNILKQYGTPVPKSGAHEFLPDIIEKFPENLFLDHFQLYTAAGAVKDWQNFDFLLLSILQDPGFNQLSYQVLSESSEKYGLFPDALMNIILYLNWQQNFDLSEKLLARLQPDIRLTPDQYRLPAADRQSRMDPDREKPPPRLDPGTITARIKQFLKQENAEVFLGENLIPRSSLRHDRSVIPHWDFSDQSDRQPFSKGSFFGAPDPIENSMRVMGFFKEVDEKKAPSRAGFWLRQPIRTEGKTYLFYFQYKTLQDTERPAFLLSEKINQEWILEPTNSKWKEVYYIFDNLKLRLYPFKPLLRMFGTGSTWFRHVYFSEISIEDSPIDKDVFFIQ
jgi:hypothetical protein